MPIDRNQIWKTKSKLEDLYNLFRKRHNEILELLDDADCISDEDSNKFYSLLKEYESDIEQVEARFLILKSNNTRIKSLFNDTRLLKKRRLAKLESNMEYNRDYDDDLPF